MLDSRPAFRTLLAHLPRRPTAWFLGPRLASGSSTRGRWAGVTRAAARVVPFRADGSIEVVIVNWDTRPYLEFVLGQVRRYSPDSTRVLVIDNGSDDDSRVFLHDTPLAHAVLLPRNIGHAAALDLAFLSSPAEYVVSLDVDAFPIHGSWLDLAIDPIRDGRAHVAGAHLRPGRVHPCYLVMRRERFVRRGHSFGFVRSEHLDTGEAISRREDRLWFLDPTSTRGPGPIGTVFAEAVYHNTYTARFRQGADQLDDIPRAEAEAAWAEAVARYG